MIVLFATRSVKQSAGRGSAAAIAKVTGVPVATLARIGIPSTSPPIAKLPDGTPAVESGGKPVVLYLGAEYCPFCAVERWAVVVALSRFGTFSNLGTTTSSATDAYPNTPTLSFHGSSYTSDYLVFSSVETQTNTGEPLDTPTAEQQQLFATYDVRTYTGAGDHAIPFVMIGNRFVWSGATYDPNVLQGLSFDQIANELANPDSAVARSVDGAANRITAMICQLTNGQPSTVCSAPFIQQASP